MSTRRSRQSSYTQRLRQPAAPAQRRPAPPKRGTTVAGRGKAQAVGQHHPLPGAQRMVLAVPALLALLAEAGHLGAALVEWPGGAARGWWHVCVAAALGFAAVGIYFGLSRVELTVGLVAASATTPGWAAGAALGWSPYDRWPWPAALAVSTLEVAMVVLLVSRWRLARMA